MFFAYTKTFVKRPMRKELREIRERYERRSETSENLYDPLESYHSMLIVEKQLALIRLIKTVGLVPVAEKRVLEIGCGSGTNLLQLISLGFRPENLVANELLEERAREARHRLPTATKVITGDASELDFVSQSFDVVMQSTVFTSILSDCFQQELARHMWKLVKPGGGVLWYDYIYNNPRNRDVRGVSIRRIRELFPNGRMKFWRLTLAPPIGRLVTKICLRLYSICNVVPVLRTHVLCWIEKEDESIHMTQPRTTSCG